MHRFASNLARSNTVHRIRYALLKKLRYWTSQGTVESPISVVLKPISSRGHTILFTPFAHSAMGLTRNISLLTRNVCILFTTLTLYLLSSFRHFMECPRVIYGTYVIVLLFYTSLCLQEY